MTTETQTDKLFKLAMAATQICDSAAGKVAYDLTFRAEDEYNGQHDRPTAALTARLKAAYRTTHAAQEGAWAAYNAVAYLTNA